ncbi:hypothetical protein ANN_09586 [Periplaneta americana]|uniref:Uncharacterized protein n=1 Tax=Periplaneta americana TaxID=6978 RepID=A0ABQ8TLP8_PERAM|nr:hypothetical protein ANN_09586 [Periplaneta americana]
MTPCASGITPTATAELRREVTDQCARCITVAMPKKIEPFWEGYITTLSDARTSVWDQHCRGTKWCGAHVLREIFHGKGGVISLWGIIKQHVSKHRYETIKDLKQAVREAFREIIPTAFHPFHLNAKLVAMYSENEVRSEDSPKYYPAFAFWLGETSENPNQVIKSKGVMPRTRHRVAIDHPASVPRLRKTSEETEYQRGIQSKPERSSGSAAQRVCRLSYIDGSTKNCAKCIQIKSWQRYTSCTVRRTAILRWLAGSSFVPERYPQRQCPDRKTFVRLHYHLCEYGKFNSPGLGRGRPRSTTPEVQEEILEAVNMTPSISTRRVALQVNLKSLVYSSPVPDLESLRNRIVACSEDIRNTPGVWDRVRRSMRHRCEVCIQAGGGHFEHLL